MYWGVYLSIIIYVGILLLAGYLSLRRGGEGGEE